jgi:hypothetical protein
MLLVYRHRWTGTETFHRDGKQQLGLGDCQMLEPLPPKSQAILGGDSEDPSPRGPFRSPAC